MPVSGLQDPMSRPNWLHNLRRLGVGAISSSSSSSLEMYALQREKEKCRGSILRLWGHFQPHPCAKSLLLPSLRHYPIACNVTTTLEGHTHHTILPTSTHHLSHTYLHPFRPHLPVTIIYLWEPHPSLTSTVTSLRPHLPLTSLLLLWRQQSRTLSILLPTSTHCTYDIHWCYPYPNP